MKKVFIKSLLIILITAIFISCNQGDKYSGKWKCKNGNGTVEFKLIKKGTYLMEWTNSKRQSGTETLTLNENGVLGVGVMLFFQQFIF